MYEFWYDYIKPKYQQNAKPLTLQMMLKKRFNTSNYEVNTPLPSEKNKKVIGLLKDKLGGNIMTEFIALRPKSYCYIMNDGSNDKW